MQKLKSLTIAVLLFISIILAGPSLDVSAKPLAATAPDLGDAESFSVLAATTVTNSGATSMPGDLGVYPGDAVTGEASLTVGGTIYKGTVEAQDAQADADLARLALEAQGPGTTLASSQLAGESLVAGVYTVPGTALLSGGALTLDGPGVYIFLTNGLTTTGTVNLTNGADPCNVFWRDASSVAIGGGEFVGTIIALTSISMGTGATLEGRAIAQNGEVTLLNNTITGPTCIVPTATPQPPDDEDDSPTDTPPTPTETPAPPVAAPATATESLTEAELLLTATTVSLTATTVSLTEIAAQTATAFPGMLPGTGGAPVRSSGLPWGLAIVAGFGVIALVLGVRAYHSAYRRKQ